MDGEEVEASGAPSKWSQHPRKQRQARWLVVLMLPGERQRTSFSCVGVEKARKTA